MDQRLVLFRVDLDFKKVSGRPGTGARDDLDRFAGRELPIHAGGGDTDPLLAAAHPHPMELRTVEQFGEDARNMLADDAGPVVRHRDPEPGGLAGRRGRAVGRHDFELDGYVRQNSGFLTGIERVIDGFFHAGQQRFPRIVEPQQMPVLGEKFRNRDLPLSRAHLDRGDLLCRFRGRLLRSG